MQWLARTLRLDWLTHSGVRQIVALRLKAFVDDAWHGPAQLLGELPDDATRALCTQAMAESDRMLANPADHPGADAQRVARIKAEREKARVATLQDVLTRLRNEFIDRRMVELNREREQTGDKASARAYGSRSCGRRNAVHRAWRTPSSSRPRAHRS